MSGSNALGLNRLHALSACPSRPDQEMDALVVRLALGRHLHLVLVAVTAAALDAHPQGQAWVAGLLLGPCDLLQSVAECELQVRDPKGGERRTAIAGSVRIRTACASAGSIS